MSSLARAIQIATAVTARSRAEGEARFILPPLRVMLALEHDEECMAAVLQPLHQEGHITLAGLVAAGFPPAVVRAVDAMTPQPGETRLDAAARASTDPIARTVRLVECTEEVDFTGLPGLTGQDFALIEEYRLVREVLVAGVLHDESLGLQADALPEPRETAAAAAPAAAPATPRACPQPGAGAGAEAPPLPQRVPGSHPRPPHRRTTLLVALALVLGGCAGESQGPVTLRAARLTVSDGDSLRVGEQRYRLWGIDAPELSQRCRDEGDRSYGCGNQAREYLDRLIGNRDLTCTPKEEDRHGRVVATCEVAGIDLGHAMVEAGHALDYPRYSGGHYASAQARAEGSRAGMWRGTFTAPWKWRKEQRQR